MSESKNIVEATLDEIERCTKLIGIYEMIGPAGVFGKTMIQYDIQVAKQAISGGDPIEIMKALERLRGCE